jgi:L-aminoadipate-semialdehyde dehydrogenase
MGEASARHSPRPLVIERAIDLNNSGTLCAARAVAHMHGLALAPDPVYHLRSSQVAGRTSHLVPGVAAGSTRSFDMSNVAAGTATLIAPLAGEATRLLTALGVDASRLGGGARAARSPVTGEILAHVHDSSAAEANAAIDEAHAASLAWRLVPAPKRGELVRLLGEELRAHKAALGRLVSIEAGKIASEGLGEVQEMIDICDFAVGLSRQLYGLTIATERAEHRMMETWHPLGVTGIISAFNFPVAVWAWNAALALVCGNSIVWKPSEKTPLTALATDALLARAIERFRSEGGAAPEGLSALLIGGREVGEILVDHARVPLVSATGSTAMGRVVGARLASRFARAILELGGNNAAIVTPSADLDLTLRAVAFAAMGTAGQRCTSLRRLFVHEDVYARLVPRLKQAYASVTVGNPLEEGSLIGPLIDGLAYRAMQTALAAAEAEGGVVCGGERVALGGCEEAYYVRPALVEITSQIGPVVQETFAPILYVIPYRDFDAVIEMHNAVPQGLSSSIFTNDLREAELFLSARGSDCGIANVNIGPSGAEIGGAFGGEKETGGGRESGSDAWKAYMRRATNTVNYGRTLPLAQGVRFDIG